MLTFDAVLSVPHILLRIELLSLVGNLVTRGHAFSYVHHLYMALEAVERI